MARCRPGVTKTRALYTRTLHLKGSNSCRSGNSASIAYRLTQRWSQHCPGLTLCHCAVRKRCQACAQWHTRASPSDSTETNARNHALRVRGSVQRSAFTMMNRVAQWIAHQTSNLGVAGSSPAVVTTI